MWPLGDEEEGQKQNGLSQVVGLIGQTQGRPDGGAERTMKTAVRGY